MSHEMHSTTDQTVDSNGHTSDTVPGVHSIIPIRQERSKAPTRADPLSIIHENLRRDSLRLEAQSEQAETISADDFLKSVLAQQLSLEEYSIKLSHEKYPDVRLYIKSRAAYTDYIKEQLADEALNRDLKDRAGNVPKDQDQFKRVKVKGEIVLGNYELKYEEDKHINDKAFLDPDKLLAFKAIILGGKVPIETIAWIYNLGLGSTSYESGHIRMAVRTTESALRSIIREGKATQVQRELFALLSEEGGKRRLSKWEQRLASWGKVNGEIQPIKGLSGKKYIYSLLLREAVGNVQIVEGGQDVELSERSNGTSPLVESTPDRTSEAKRRRLELIISEREQLLSSIGVKGEHIEGAGPLEGIVDDLDIARARQIVDRSRTRHRIRLSTLSQS